MLIKTCSQCQFHEVKKEEAQMSYCRKENCWAELTDCITKKAVERFLNGEYVTSDSVLPQKTFNS